MSLMPFIVSYSYIASSAAFPFTERMGTMLWYNRKDDSTHRSFAILAHLIWPLLLSVPRPSIQRCVYLCKIVVNLLGEGLATSATPAMRLGVYQSYNR